MSSGKENNPGIFVRVEDCRERHVVMKAGIDKLELALFGNDGRGGLVQDISEIKSDIREFKNVYRGKLVGRDKAYIISAIVLAVTSIIVAILK